MLHHSEIKFSQTSVNNMAVGIRTKFDMSAVATQILSSLVSSAIQAETKELIGEGVAGRVTSTSASAAANNLIGSGITHTPLNIQNMAAQAIGNSVSNEVGGSLQNEHAKSQSAGRSRHHPQQRQQHHQAVNDAAGWNKRK